MPVNTIAAKTPPIIAPPSRRKKFQAPVALPSWGGGPGELSERGGAPPGRKAVERERGKARDDHRAAELAEEVQGAGRGAKLVRQHRVLDQDGGDGIHGAEAGPADRE